MYKKLVILLLILSSNIATSQTKIGDVTMQNTHKVGNKTLVLNGGGIREKYFIDLYVAGLYLEEKMNDPKRIIEANSPMVIKIQIVSGMITSEKMRQAVNEGFEKSTKGNIKTFQTQIAQFTKAFEDEIKVNDVFEIVYNQQETQVLKNSKVKCSIPGHDFKKAVFGIWLSENPADADLKMGMLGK